MSRPLFRVPAIGRTSTSPILFMPQANAINDGYLAGAPGWRLGEGDLTKWGYQVIMQSNEGFPDKTDLLTRKVNEYEGQHRFGGGNDGDCDPHVIDLLAGKAVGDKSEADAQHQMLAYECNDDGTPKKLATLKLIRK